MPLSQHDTLPILPLSFPLDIDKSTLMALVPLVNAILCGNPAADKSIFLPRPSYPPFDRIGLTLRVHKMTMGLLVALAVGQSYSTRGGNQEACIARAGTVPPIALLTQTSEVGRFWRYRETTPPGP